MRARAWRGDAKTIGRHVAYVGAAGVHFELRAQTRLPWQKCLLVGARACVYARAGTHAYAHAHIEMQDLQNGNVHKRMDMHCPSTRVHCPSTRVGSEIGTVF